VSWLDELITLARTEPAATDLPLTPVLPDQATS
jgi:hypothetical protein